MSDLMKPSHKQGLTRGDDVMTNQVDDVGSRLKRELMAAMLDDPKPVLGKGETPRVILALANYQRSIWNQAKVLQADMFREAAGTGLEMKFAYYGPEVAGGVRTCRITTRWISDAYDMATVMGRAECVCGCYIHISRVLGQALKETQERTVQAVVIIGEAFHDDLDEAAILATQLGRAGTKLFMFQEGYNPVTEHAFRFLAEVSGGAYFQFGPRTEKRLAEMLKAVSHFATGGKEGLEAKGGEAATLMLEQIVQVPMPLVEKDERVTPRVTR
jgi:hypothetical protein